MKRGSVLTVFLGVLLLGVGFVGGAYFGGSRYRLSSHAWGSKHRLIYRIDGCTGKTWFTNSEPYGKTWSLVDEQRKSAPTTKPAPATKGSGARPFNADAILKELQQPIEKPEKP